MDDKEFLNSGDGWSQYKIAVMNQLEFLTSQLEVIREMVVKVDKEVGTISSREKTDSDFAILTEKINQLFLWKATQEGKQARSNLISIIAVILSSLFALIHVLQSFRIIP